MNTLTKRFLRDVDGATTIEYGLIAGLISVVILGALGAIGTQLNAKFSNIANALN